MSKKIVFLVFCMFGSLVVASQNNNQRDLLKVRHSLCKIDPNIVYTSLMPEQRLLDIQKEVLERSPSCLTCKTKQFIRKDMPLRITEEKIEQEWFSDLAAWLHVKIFLGHGVELFFEEENQPLLSPSALQSN